MGIVQSIPTRRNLQPSVSAFGPRIRIERRQLKGHTSDTKQPISQVLDFKIPPGMGDHPTSMMVRALLLAILTVDHIDYLIRRYAIGILAKNPAAVNLGPALWQVAARRTPRDRRRTVTTTAAQALEFRQAGLVYR